jgi:hypothetical protein
MITGPAQRQPSGNHALKCRKQLPPAAKACAEIPSLLLWTGSGPGGMSLHVRLPTDCNRYVGQILPGFHGTLPVF